MPPDQTQTTGISIDASGGFVTPLYTERRMRCYQIFDSELKSLGLTTAIVTVCFSMGTACLTTALNLSRDIVLSGKMTEGAAALDAAMKPACYVLAVIFFIAGAAALWWRHDLISLIKSESGESATGFRIWRSPVKRTPAS